MNESTNNNFENFLSKIEEKNYLKLELMNPIVKRYGLQRTECLLSSKIFNQEDINITKEIISFFSIGLSKDLDSILQIISEMIDDGILEIKTILYVFKMGYDYTFTINLILQFNYLLKAMSKYKIEKISDKINYKSMYTFFRECDLSLAVECAKLLEEKNENFFNELNELEIKLAHII